MTPYQKEIKAAIKSLNATVGYLKYMTDKTPDGHWQYTYGYKLKVLNSIVELEKIATELDN